MVYTLQDNRPKNNIAPFRKFEMYEAVQLHYKVIQEVVNIHWSTFTKFHPAWMALSKCAHNVNMKIPMNMHQG